MSTTASKSSRLWQPRWTALLFLVLALGACSNIETKRRDWSDYTGPGAEYFTQEEVPFPQFYPDSAEPFNRAMDKVDEAFMLYIIRPLGAGWRFITTDGIRDHLGQAHTNLAYPGRLVNNLLQGKWSNAGTETSRFLINSTVGLLGIFDPADSWGIPAPPPEDTGLTLEAAGWTNPNYLVLPGLGPSSTRDAVGAVPDYFMNIATYLAFWVNPFFIFNELSDLVVPYTNLVNTNDDPYEILRALYSIKRSADLIRYQFVEAPDSKSEETLQAIFLGPHDPDFIKRSTTRTVEIPATGKELPYTYWLQDKPAPMVFVLPGTGSHRLSNHAVGLSEYMWDAGYSAVCISNSMNFEFMDNAATVNLPGYLPADAHDSHVAFDLIHKAIEARHPGHMTTKAIAGLSLGAMQVVYMAAEENDSSSGLVSFDAYISVASPVRLQYAVDAIDGFYNAPLKWKADERIEKMNETLHMALRLAGNEHITPGKPFPFSEIQADYLIGLDFRFTLLAVLFNTQYRHNMGVLLTELDDWDRGPAYKEISDYSFAEYIYAFALPYFSEIRPEVNSAEDLFWHTSLFPLEEKLRKAERLRLFTNKMDPLQSDSDREWERDVFGDRIEIGESGGHMGNAPNPKAVKAFMSAVKELIDEAEAARSTENAE